MTLQKPSVYVLTVWRLRLLLVSLIPSFLSAYFSTTLNWIWWTFTAAWVLAFLYFYIFYYPIKYRKLAYTRNKRCLLIHCGVIYTRVKAIPFTGIQYATLASTPLQRLFGICSLFVCSAGSTAYIPGMTPQDAIALQRLLTPEDDVGGEPLE